MASLRRGARSVFSRLLPNAPSRRRRRRLLALGSRLLALGSSVCPVAYIAIVAPTFPPDRQTRYFSQLCTTACLPGPPRFSNRRLQSPVFVGQFCSRTTCVSWPLEIIVVATPRRAASLQSSKQQTMTTAAGPRDSARLDRWLSQSVPPSKKRDGKTLRKLTLPVSMCASVMSHQMAQDELACSPARLPACLPDCSEFSLCFFACRSVARSVAASFVRSLARSVNPSVRSSVRPCVRSSVGRSVGRSVARSLARAAGTFDRASDLSKDAEHGELGTPETTTLGQSSEGTRMEDLRSVRLSRESHTDSPREGEKNPLEITNPR